MHGSVWFLGCGVAVAPFSGSLGQENGCIDGYMFCLGLLGGACLSFFFLRNWAFVCICVRGLAGVGFLVLDHLTLT